MLVSTSDHSQQSKRVSSAFAPNSRPGVGELLHLLTVYEMVLAFRPIHQGNREFLEVLLSSVSRLTDRLLRMNHQPPIRESLRTVAALVHTQTLRNAQSSAREILEKVNAIKENPENNRKLVVNRFLTPLDNDYSQIVVIFGPGLGLGDEITFRQFLVFLKQHLPTAPMAVYSLYSGLWRGLLDGIRCFHYRGQPWRPFSVIDRLAEGHSSQEKALVLLADFDGYRFHEQIIPHVNHVHVLEISLGLKRAWLRRSASGWLECASFESSRIPNNYWNLLSLAQTLFSIPKRAIDPWSPLQKPGRNRPRSGCLKIFLNPLSSKAVPVTSESWVRTLRRLLCESFEPRIRIMGFPGLHKDSLSEVRSLMDELSQVRGIQTEILSGQSGGPLTPHNALVQIIRSLKDVDLCITVDTFTAHLAPLFGVPTIVVALKDNRAFWVPSPIAFYCFYQEMEAFIPNAAAHLLTPNQNVGYIERRLSSCVVAATHRALKKGSRKEIQALQESLLSYSLGVTSSASLSNLLKPWVFFFSRFLRCLRQQQLPKSDLEPFLLKWKYSELFKFIQFQA